jgi:hypothetical protein
LRDANEDRRKDDGEKNDRLAEKDRRSAHAFPHGIRNFYPGRILACENGQKISTARPVKEAGLPARGPV